MSATWRTWRDATERALYGDGGFYRHPAGRPAHHFRTSVHASPLFAGAVRDLARSAGLDTVVDVGAGGGELLRELARLEPHWRLVGVEVAPRPDGLPPSVRWTDVLPDPLTGLVVANEWLDNVAVDVVEHTAHGPRLVEVDGHGNERLGAPAAAADLDWLATWWPLRATGDRAEVGRPRDEAWAGVLARLAAGVAVAVDYAHTRDARPPGGSLAGYRHGRRVAPVPDGSCDLTSHVALDACAAAGLAAGATASVLTDQRSALIALGVDPVRPGHGAAATDPAGYLRALARAGEAAELTRPDGLGGFGWLVQCVGVPLPPPLVAARPPAQRAVTGTEA